MYRSLCLATVVLCLLTGPMVAQPVEVAPQQPCCGVKPAYNDPAYALFTGQVAVVTYEQVPPTTDVMRIIDLSGITTTNPPPNTNYVPPVYKNPAWNATRLGTIFGNALDDAG